MRFQQSEGLFRAQVFNARVRKLPIPPHADQRITQNLACAAVCDLGLFGASPHLGAVHQSLAPASAGVPFERVRALPATVHGGRFSPCNAQFRVPIGGDEADAALSAHSFFAVAHDAANSRYVIIGVKRNSQSCLYTILVFAARSCSMVQDNRAILPRGRQS